MIVYGIVKIIIKVDAESWNYTVAHIKHFLHTRKGISFESRNNLTCANFREFMIQCFRTGEFTPCSFSNINVASYSLIIKKRL